MTHTLHRNLKRFGYSFLIRANSRYCVC